MNNRLNRWAGAVLLGLTILYVSWLVRSVNRDALWLSVPFVVASVSVLIGSLLHWCNNWERHSPTLHSVRRGEEPDVAVIIPTYGEPVDMVMRTLASVLDQDYPSARLTVVVSDDGRSAQMEAAVERAAQRSDANVLYHRPPTKGDPGRRGEGKAGNLNSAMERLAAEGCDATFVETRDADDLVGDRSFLRLCVGHLLAKPELGFVQTVKTAEVATGDPFGNLMPNFYQGAMFAKNASSAAFPCGSGLVWRRTALEDIGHFPDWNMVEDVQSGINAMRATWRGEAIGIVGAHAQHAPDDLPNVFKQRGIWALDTMRLMFWGSLRGLSMRQRLHFYETYLFYLNGFAWITLTLSMVLTMVTGQPLLVDEPWRVTVFLWSMLIANELFHAASAYDHRFQGVWRERQVSANLSVLWAAQTVRALFSGPHRKPTYRVTRKVADHRVHLRFVLPQIIALVALVGGFALAVGRSGGIGNTDAARLPWLAYFLVVYGTFIPRAWFGVAPQLTAPRLGVWLAEAGRRLVGAPDAVLCLATAAPVGRAPVVSLEDRTTTERRRVATAQPTTSWAVPSPSQRSHPRMRVGVMGAGIGGLTVARLLRDSGHEVTVYEANDHCGGLAASFTWHGVACDFGPHRFLPDDPTIVEEVATLVPLRTVVRSSRIRLRGRWVREPINPIELVFKFLPREGLGLVWHFVTRNRKGPDGNFDEQSLARFGKGLTNLFFRPYSEKLFGIPATEISPGWGRRKLRAAGIKDLLKKRSRLSFSEFWYPARGGYGAIADALEAQVHDRVRYQHRLQSLTPTRSGGYEAEFTTAAGEVVDAEFDVVVSTLPGPLIARMLGTEVELRFRSLDLYYLHIAKPRVTQYHWFYFADGLDRSVVNRVTEFTNFGTPSDDPFTTVICCEVTETDMGSLDRVIGELVGAGLIEESDVLDHTVVHVRNAYPIYDLASDDEQPRMTELFARHPNLFHVGRSANFAHEDIDEVYVEARGVVEELRARSRPASRVIDLRDGASQRVDSASRTAS
jgi:cellulose synthase (UDP-forming)